MGRHANLHHQPSHVTHGSHVVSGGHSHVQTQGHSHVQPQGHSHVQQSSHHTHQPTGHSHVQQSGHHHHQVRPSHQHHSHRSDLTLKSEVAHVIENKIVKEVDVIVETPVMREIIKEVPYDVIIERPV